jgi:hypothetical protein
VGRLGFPIRCAFSRAFFHHARIVILAGLAACSIRQPDVSNPASQEGQFTVLTVLPEAYHASALVGINQDQVLLCGGRTILNKFVAECWVISLECGRKERWPDLPMGGIANARAYLSPKGNQVILAEGWNRIMVLDLQSRAWSVSTPWSEGGCAGGSAILRSGVSLVCGDLVSPSRKAALYDPSSGTWKRLPDLKLARKGHRAFRLSTGAVLVAGGITEEETISHVIRLFSVTNQCETYHPEEGRFMDAPRMKDARGEYAACVLSDGTLMVAGGCVGQSILTRSVECFDPRENCWKDVMPLPEVRYRGELVGLPNGAAVLVGGYDPHDPELDTSHTLLYDPQRRTWVRGPRLRKPKEGYEYGCTAAVVGKQVVVAIGDSVQAISLDKLCPVGKRE